MVESFEENAANVSATATFTLVATVKDEGPYLWEWVAYHRMIGFDNIIIFQNDSLDGTHKILSEMARHNFITYKYNKAPRGSHQVRAYKRAAREPSYLASDWVMALDLDEFLVIHVGQGTLTDLLGALPNFDCAYINWLKFGSSGFTEIQDGLVSETFTQCENGTRLATGVEAFKSLFRRVAYDRPGVHKPLLAATNTDEMIIVNGSGLKPDSFITRNFQCSDPGLKRYAQVNHYIVKDVSSFILKSAKGRAHQANRGIDEKYWKTRNKNQTEDFRLAKMAPRIINAMNAMDQVASGRLSELTTLARSHHRNTFKTILNEPSALSLYKFCKGG